MSVSNAMEKIYLKMAGRIAPPRHDEMLHASMLARIVRPVSPPQRRVGDNPPYLHARIMEKGAALLLAIFLLSFLVFTSQLFAATNSGIPAPNRVPGRTNSLSSLPSARPKTNAVATSKAVTGKGSALDRAKTQISSAFQNLRSSRAFYPVVAGVTVCLVLAIVFLSRFFKSKTLQQQEAGALTAPSLAS